MFEIGWTEILVIAIVAIVVFPSKDLPKLLRTAGQMVGKLRRMAGDFQGQFNAALREAEREIDLEETRKKVEDLKSLNPMSQVKQALNPLSSSVADIKKSIQAPGPGTPATSQFVPPPPPPAVPPPVSSLVNATADPAPASAGTAAATAAPIPKVAAKPKVAPKPKAPATSKPRTAGARPAARDKPTVDVDRPAPIATTTATAAKPAVEKVLEPAKPAKPRAPRKTTAADGDKA